MDAINTSSPPMVQMHCGRPAQPETASMPIIVQAPKSGPLHFDRDQLTSLKATSTTQLICGLLAIIFEAIRLATSGSNGVGIWSGIFFLVAGILGLVEAFKNKKSLLIATTILSLLSSLMLFCIIGIMGSAIDYCELRYEYSNVYCKSRDYVIGCFMIIISVVELIASIWASVICCKALYGADTMRLVCCTEPGLCCCTSQPVYYVWNPSEGSQITSGPPVEAAASRQYPAPAAAPPAVHQLFYSGATQPPAMSTTNYAAGARGQNFNAA